MKKLILFVLCLLVAVPSFAEGKYENEDFSIDALVGYAEDVNVSPLIMSLPALDNFSPNVNVQIQSYEGTLKEYYDLSVGQFEEFGMKLIKSDLTEDRLMFEYSGDMQGRVLHWYAVAYKKNSQVYLATATATQGQWESFSENLISVVNSFKMK